MLRMLVRDVASPDHGDRMFPFLRCFDPYAGHSWASGHAKFGDGNNNESSSEAVNAWFGLMMLGEVLEDRALRDLGAWLMAVEVSAIEDYWFDVRDELHPAAYGPSVVTMVWGGKGANATWFSANPEAVHGINFLPMTGGSLYLGRWPEYVRRNYAALVRENLEFDRVQAQRKSMPAPTHDGTQFDQWADLLWMYQALGDPGAARRAWDSRPARLEPEPGNSRIQTGAWIAALEEFGSIDRTVSADAPFAVTFVRDGRRTHFAWNVSGTARKVRFSDGVVVECPIRGFGRK
jgi:endoglucanase Acf2